MDKPTLEFLLSNSLVNCREVTIKKLFPEFWEYVNNIYKSEPTKWVEKLYWYFHNINKHPKCPICGNPVEFITFKNGYKIYCSVECMHKDYENIKKRTAETNLKKYGAENPMKLKEVRDKIKATNLKKYGAENPMSSDIVKNKIKNSLIKKYGVESTWKIPGVQEKSRKSMMERHGVEWAQQSADIRKKTKKTTYEHFGGIGFGSEVLCKKTRDVIEERYGVRYALQNKDIMNKTKTIINERYGGIGCSSTLIANKIKQTNIERYGVDHNFRIGIYDKYPELIGIREDGSWICKCEHADCNKCSEKQYITYNNLHCQRKKFNTETCTILNPLDSGSGPEQSIGVFLQNMGVQFEQHNRTILHPAEIDFYIPSKNIGIEFNGVYWHSDLKKDKNYHIDKYLNCKKNNVQLIQIWEDWWCNKHDIVLSILKSKLGLISDKIYARDCICEQINNKDGLSFINKNHIQGKCRAKIYYGLLHNNELVSVMAFNKRSKLSGNKHLTDDDWELVRFCNKIDTTVIGGASKLLKHFIKDVKPSLITSFSCNDISDGHLYEELGFISDHKVNNAYWYIDSNTHERFHRTSFTKNAIIKKGLAGANGNWTEKEIMNTTKYLRIHDSGTTKWILDLKSC